MKGRESTIGRKGKDHRREGKGPWKGMEWTKEGKGRTMEGKGKYYRMEGKGL